MHRLLAPLSTALVAILVAFASPAARAQDQGPPPRSDEKSENGEYRAPMSQTTQPSYVPQSVALSGPETIDDWDETRRVPAGYHPEQRKRKGLIISGAILFGSAYLISAFSASVGADLSNHGNNAAAALFVPVVGPFIQMATWDSSTGRFFLAIDGACQVAGVAMVLAGISQPKIILVRNDLGATLVPLHTRDGGNGLALVGHF